MTVKKKVRKAYGEGLWRLFNRPEIPATWIDGGNLPWNDPEFSKRMLREHLDQSHGAASRVTDERLMVIDWLWKRLRLQEGKRLLDVTCGPGLYAVEFARRGCHVTGIDFGPASIAYAREQVGYLELEDRCHFIEQDITEMKLSQASFDAAIFLYGQLTVFPEHQAQALLEKIARSLKPGGRLCVELLDPDSVDKAKSSWWFTDDTGLWGDQPFLHLGERFWLDEEQMSVERFFTLNLETGVLDEVTLCDMTYSADTMVEMMKQAGFAGVEFYRGWDGVPLNDAGEWIVYIAKKSSHGEPVSRSE